MTEAQVISLVVGPGGALALLVFMGYMWVSGKIHSHPEFRREVDRGEEWKQLFEDERAAHQTTREALAVANDRADAAVETAKITKELLESSRHQLPRGASGKS